MATYSLDPIADNCYHGTTVLINKFNIQDADKLLRAEIAITQEAAARWEFSPQNNSFDFEHYKAIHKHLLGELYDWAGQIRTVNISKKGKRFCPHDEIENQAKRVFARLREADFLRNLTRNKFIAEFVDLYNTTNYLHPFRESNGRTQRLFLAQLARNAGYTLDFADIDVDRLMIATIQSAQGVEDGLRQIFTDTVKKSSMRDTLHRAQKRVDSENENRTSPKRKNKDSQEL